MSPSRRVRHGLVVLLASAALMTGAAGCGVISCGAPASERIPGHLAEADIVLTSDAELVGVGHGCWQDHGIYFTIAVPVESVDELLRASRFDSPLEPLTSPEQVGDGRAFSTVEPGPGVVHADEMHHDSDFRQVTRSIVVDYSDPDRVMVHINYLR